MSRKPKPRGTFKPMLAEGEGLDLEILDYPIYGSPKLDGWRCPILNGEAVTRSLKPMPNHFVREYLSRLDLSGMDGEIIVGEPTALDCYAVTDPLIKREKGEPLFRFFVFDDFTNPDSPYSSRLLDLQHRMQKMRRDPRVVLHEYKLLQTPDEVREYEAECVEKGYEGLILRSPSAPYKYGRSTMREEGMLKVKRFTDKEFRIVGYYEMMKNGNEAFTNELGHTQRSSKQEGMVPTGMLGGLTCVMDDGETTFDVGGGPGLTLKRRKELWDIRDTLPGLLAKVKFLEARSKMRPSSPGLREIIGFRSPEDMS